MRDHCNGERSLEAVLLARRGLVAAVRSTRDWPTEGLRVFVEEDRRKEEVVLLRGKAVLHSTLLKPPERVGGRSRINAGTARQREGGVSTVGRQRKHQSKLAT